MSCKCVCNPWLDLLMTPEFVKSHISKSVPVLVVFLKGDKSKPYKIFEFEDEYHWNTVFNLDLPFHEPLHSSCNGLLFMCKRGFRRGGDLLLCNPFTHDYMQLSCAGQGQTYGFGVSRMSGQYKVVRIFIARQRKTPLDQFKCQVYTVGTGSWRGIAFGGTLRYDENTVGAFLNGNLHWLAREGSSRRISCLDLETELFSTFSLPPCPPDEVAFRNLSVLWDCLCVCDSWGSECISDYMIDIWLMKQFIIHNVDMGDYLGKLYPIKVFKDSDILMELIVGLGCSKLVYYSSKAKTIQEDAVLGLESKIFSSTTIFTPSFLSLNTFAMENVSSF